MPAIPRTFVINMKSREDRRDSFIDRANAAGLRLGFDYQFVDAIIGDRVNPPPFWSAGNGAWGCYKSHIHILEKCLNEGIGSALILEDDAVFRDNFLEDLMECSKHLPSDWDMFYPGGALMHTNSRIPTVINSKICRVYNVNRTHAYMISAKGLPKVYKYLHMTPFPKGFHIDHQLGVFHESFKNKIYAPHKWLVGQHGSPSSVSGKNEPVTFFTNPKNFFVDHHLYRKPICFLFTGNTDYIPELRQHLHFGNSVSNDNTDPLLADIDNLKNPIPKITEWYNWVRAECTRSANKDLLPAAANPFLSQELLKESGVEEVYHLDSSDGLKGIIEQISMAKTRIRNEQA